jgi:hypothetical protein
MKKIICRVTTILFASFLPGRDIYCQGLYNSAQLIASGNGYIIIQDGGFNNNGAFVSGTGTVVITGTAATNISTIGGGNATPFNNLIINKTTNEAQLAGNISVDGNLTMQSGNLELNLFNIDLGSGGGTLINENNNARVAGVNGGYIIKTVNLNGPSAVNPGNIGIVITSASNLGSTVIKRGHKQQTSPSGYSIERYFDIVPANNTSLDATLQLFYFDDELAGINKTELNFYKSEDNGANWLFVGNDNNDETNDWVLKNHIGQLSRWTLSSNIHNPLPLKLLSFAVKLVNRQSQLKWVTEEETNTGHFDVQRSADGISFTNLTTIPAQGNSSLQNTYHVIDPKPFEGATYYRLKEVDRDGNSSFSPVEYVKLDDGITYSLYPNPASSVFYLNIHFLTAQKVSFELYDVNGRLVQEQNVTLIAGNNLLQWDISLLAKGTYYLRSSSPDILSMKIVNQ